MSVVLRLTESASHAGNHVDRVLDAFLRDMAQPCSTPGIDDPDVELSTLRTGDVVHRLLKFADANAALAFLAYWRKSAGPLAALVLVNAPGNSSAPRAAAPQSALLSARVVF